MQHDPVNPYDIEPHIAELYDLAETTQDDVALLRRLIGPEPRLRILEPFCGTGRILLPLALDGHIMVGIDQSHNMLNQARRKTNHQPVEVQQRVTLVQSDVVHTCPWPDGFDGVILGGNCFYELATPEEQEECVRLAAAALKPGGWIYIDNDHQEGALDLSWQDTGTVKRRGIMGTCADGTVLESFIETTWFDAPKRLVRFKRWNRITQPDGSTIEKVYTQQKHPVSAAEVRCWLEKHGFQIEQQFGDRDQSPYTDDAPRAIFWARRKA
jgi:SAM-dependent methyltransferase